MLAIFVGGCFSGFGWFMRILFPGRVDQPGLIACFGGFLLSELGVFGFCPFAAVQVKERDGHYMWWLS